MQSNACICTIWVSTGSCLIFHLQLVKVLMVLENPVNALEFKKFCALKVNEHWNMEVPWKFCNFYWLQAVIPKLFFFCQALFKLNNSNTWVLLSSFPALKSLQFDEKEPWKLLKLIVGLTTLHVFFKGYVSLKR